MQLVRYDKMHRTQPMHHIDYEGAFGRSVFATIPEGEKRDLAGVYQGLLEAGNLAAYDVHERFYEIGSSVGLRETSEFLTAVPQSKRD
jgi:MurNAc alpha-1-phosphate uridylyltransferase